MYWLCLSARRDAIKNINETVYVSGKNVNFVRGIISNESNEDRDSKEQMQLR